MIDLVHLKNFQAHEDTIIEPAPSLTSLTGQSDQGKTSVIRGFKKVRDNRPMGNKFIRNGEKTASVTINDVTVSITGSKTIYTVGEETFKALRGNVPEEVTDALQLGPENIQEQHDSIFLLNQSPGKVAQFLAKLAELEEGQNALQYIKELKRNATSELDALQTNIAQNKTILENLSDIDTINEQYAKIERKRSRVVQMKAEYTNLYVIIKKAAEAKIRLSETPDVQHLITKVVALQKSMAEISILKQEAKQLTSIVHTAEKAERSIGPDPAPIIQKLEKLGKLRVQAGDLAIKIKYAQHCEKELDEIKRAEKEAREQWEALSGTCPLCGNEI